MRFSMVDLALFWCCTQQYCLNPTHILSYCFLYGLLYLPFVYFRHFNMYQPNNINNIKSIMLKLSRVSLILLLCCLGHALRSMSLTRSYNHNFCWKDSYGRGVGTIPAKCPSDYEKLGLLCYEPCPSGYTRWGLDCHQTCPQNWSNQGLFCRLAEYGRGVGYPWKWTDGLSGKGMKMRCQNDHGGNNCEIWGAIYYPKCRDGYRNFGCCICRPRTPNCNDLGFNGGIDLSCAKRIQIGKPSPLSCGSDEDYNAGLCYDRCKNGYNGVGPVCWSKTPNGWVDCGMGAAKDKHTCGKIISNQVINVGMLAFNIATMGASNQVSTAASKPDSALIKSFKQLQEKTKDVRELAEKIKIAGKAGVAGYGLGQILTADPNTVTTADIVRMTAELAAIAEPTGIASVVNAYSYSKCSQIRF